VFFNLISEATILQQFWLLMEPMFLGGLLRPKRPKFEAESQGCSKPPAPAGECGGAL